MATQSRILAWRIHPMGSGAWRAIVHGVARVRHDLATKQATNPGPCYDSALGMI